jgi:N-acetylglutamate synthase (EC 2.3.1.1)
MKLDIKVEKAKVTDVTQMHQLVNYFADKGDMLPRALSELYENIRDYFVVRDENQVIGCTALHVNWLDLAEIKSLAVDEPRQNQGIGSSLVQACLGAAKELGIATVFCLTRRPDFF